MPACAPPGVEADIEPIADPERALSLAYARPEARNALALIWRVDEQLAQIVATTATPAVGQMRLTWWHNALEALAPESAPAEPLLRELAAEPLVRPAMLLPTIDAWEVLLDPLPLDEAQVAAHAERGAALYAAAAQALGGAGEVEQAGRLWALVDLAFRISDPTTAGRALAQARALVTQVPRHWARPLRPLGLLALLARRDAVAGLGQRRQGAPARVMRSIGFGLFGI